MSTPADRRPWIELLHSQDTEYQRLLKTILQLGKTAEKDQILAAFETAFNTEPVEREDCVIFRHIALKFNERNRLVNVCKMVEGTTSPAEVIIKPDLNEIG